MSTLNLSPKDRGFGGESTNVGPSWSTFEKSHDGIGRTSNEVRSVDRVSGLAFLSVVWNQKGSHEG